MNPILLELIDHLSLERLEENLFRGPSKDIGTTRVYGGQVLGQALKAAQYTVEERAVHSLHAYFLREGDHNSPIIYNVERSRDGKSFSSRRVTAIQHGRPIFILSASFQKPETGLVYQDPMPDVADPEQLESIKNYASRFSGLVPEKLKWALTLAAPFDLRPTEPITFVYPEKQQPRRHTWIRATDKLTDEPELHRAILAYISDFTLLDTNLLPHGIHMTNANLQIASLDHAMWFHRDFRMDEWLLYSCEGISASGARGLARGRFYTRDGQLIASTMQEGLIRLRDSG